MLSPLRRPCTPNDLEAVHTLYMHPAVVPYLGHDPMPLADFRTVVFDSLLASGGFFCVDDAQGRLAGFYRVMRHEGRAHHVAYLGTLAVAPAAQGTGLARAMVEEAIALLQQAGVRRVELMLEADNPRALAFYRKLGFELEGTMRAAYQRAGEASPVDELFMARLLPPASAAA